MLSRSFLVDLSTFVVLVVRKSMQGRWMPIFSILCKLDKLDRNAAARLFFSFEVYLNAVLFNLLLFFPQNVLLWFSVFFSRVFLQIEANV